MLPGTFKEVKVLLAFPTAQRGASMSQNLFQELFDNHLIREVMFHLRKIVIREHRSPLTVDELIKGNIFGAF